VKKLNDEITDFAAGGGQATSEFADDVTDDTAKLRAKIFDSVQDRRDRVREKTERNVQGHEDALTRIAVLQDTLGTGTGVVKRTTREHVIRTIASAKDYHVVGESDHLCGELGISSDSNGLVDDRTDFGGWISLAYAHG
jgi:hypothetical protein